jgi:hypothetical protein
MLMPDGPNRGFDRVAALTASMTPALSARMGNVNLLIQATSV